MIQINPSSINDLVNLAKAGVPVTMTSHPGNASLYKLTLWRCGVPEHFWDITCCVADANNWPMFKLQDGKAELLVDDELHHRIKHQTNANRRFVTAYQKTKTGERLGRIHVRVCERLFPGVISSCSCLMLSEIDKVRAVFDYLAETRPEAAFSRFITPDGTMLPIRESGLSSGDLTESFLTVLKELNHLLFSDEPITTYGGACYGGAMAGLMTMLVQYWQTGRTDRYDVSGPDMINYATRPSHQKEWSEMLQFLHKWNPKLIPPHITTRMLPGTVARVGYVPGHISEDVMVRKVSALSSESSDFKRRLSEMARNDEKSWPMRIKDAQDHYFSQHDLLALGGTLVVDDFWKDVPLEGMKGILSGANSMLRIKG